MSNVYIVSYVDYGEYYIHGAFASEEKAMVYVKLKNMPHSLEGGFYSVEEIEVW